MSVLESTKRKWVISLVVCVLLAAAVTGLAILSKPSQKPEVTITYLETRFTNGTLPSAILRVTNSGRTPAHIRFANVARKDGNKWRYDLQSMVMFSSCTVEPATNCITSVPFPFNSRPGTWRVEAVVFKQKSFVGTAVFCTRRLWARLTGKGNYTRFWFPGSYARAYEINSTDIPGVALDWPPKKKKALRPVERDEIEVLPKTEFDWISGETGTRDL